MWHDVWVQSGRPKQGDIANMKRKTRLKYHYAIRYVTKENIRIRNSKMGEAISSNKDRVLWDEVEKMSKTSNNLPSIIDEKTETEEISNIFAEKYDALYNSVSYSLNDLGKLTKDIDARIDDGCTNHSHTITVKEVKDALSKLKLGKKEDRGLSSDHFMYGPGRLLVLITLIYNSILVHGVAPDDLLLGIRYP